MITKSNHKTVAQQKSVEAPAFRKKAEKKGIQAFPANKQKPQSKIKVSRQNDPYERLADNIADQVVDKSPGMTEPLSQQITPIVQRKTAKPDQPQLVPEEEYRGDSTDDLQTKAEEAIQEMPEDSEMPESDYQAKEEIQESAELQEQEEVQEKDELQEKGDQGIQEVADEVQETEEEIQSSEEDIQNKSEEEPQLSTEETQQKTEEPQQKEDQNPQKSEETIQERSFPNAQKIRKRKSIKGDLAASKGLGRPLPPKVRHEMETAFGADFSEVHMHTDAKAIQMSKKLGAQAFAHGKDIYFNSGKFDPYSRKGKHLLAHELTHTIQQGAISRPMGKNLHKKATANSSPANQNVHLSMDDADVDQIDKAEEQFPESGVHRVTPQQEKKYEEQGRALYDAIQNEINELPSYVFKGHYTSGATGGDSTSLDVYNEWFNQLQNILINLDFWGENQQKARELLVEYSIYRTAAQLGGKDKIPPNILWMLNRIGLSERNDKSILKYNKELNKKLGPGNEVELPRTGSDFMAPKGSVNWCAHAQTLALKNSGWQKSKARNYVAGEQLMQGDILTVITSKGPGSGHVVSVINHKNDRLDVVSGNAGGGEGSVRIDSVRIEQPPSNYSWNEVVSKGKNYTKSATNPSKDGTVWVINIIPIKSIAGDMPRQAPIFGPDELGDGSGTSLPGGIGGESKPGK